MTKTKKIALAVAALVIVALLVVAAVTGGSNATVNCPDCAGTGSLDCSCTAEERAECEDCEGTGKVECETCAAAGTVRASIWAILPAVIAIGLALITKEVYSSLFIGIVSAELKHFTIRFNKRLQIVNITDVFEFLNHFINRILRIKWNIELVNVGVRGADSENRCHVRIESACVQGNLCCELTFVVCLNLHSTNGVGRIFGNSAIHSRNVKHNICNLFVFVSTADCDKVCNRA